MIDIHYSHLKPGAGYIEQVEIDWVPRTGHGSLLKGTALDEWTEKLPTAMYKHGQPMRIVPNETRHLLEHVGFTEVVESVTRVCYCPRSDDIHEQEVARWFNLGLGRRLTALSCKPMMTQLGMSNNDIETLCDRVREDICSLRYRAYCRM